MLAVGLGRYKWYHSQTLTDVPVRRLSSEGGGQEAVCQQGRWAPKEGGLDGPTLIGKGNKCQRGCWAPKGGGFRDPTSIGEENKVLFYKS